MAINNNPYQPATSQSQWEYSTVGIVATSDAFFPSSIAPPSSALDAPIKITIANKFFEEVKKDVSSQSLISALALLIEAANKNANGDGSKINEAQTMIFDALMELLEKRKLMKNKIYNKLSEMSLEEIKAVLGNNSEEAKELLEKISKLIYFREQLEQLRRIPPPTQPYTQEKESWYAKLRSKWWPINTWTSTGTNSKVTTTDIEWSEK